jgi:hypothetical protein
MRENMWPLFIFLEYLANFKVQLRFQNWIHKWMNEMIEIKRIPMYT